MFLLGFVIDFIEIIFVVVPLTAPTLLALGIDPVWLGVLFAINLQTSFLTPPFGFALFYLRGVAGKMLRTLDIYRGAIPFVVLQIAGLALVWMVPSLATYLPDRLFGHDAPPAVQDDRAPAAPTAPSGSPVADDFTDLFEDPQPGRNPPYRDDFENLVERK